MQSGNSYKLRRSLSLIYPKNKTLNGDIVNGSLLDTIEILLANSKDKLDTTIDDNTIQLLSKIEYYIYLFKIIDPHSCFSLLLYHIHKLLEAKYHQNLSNSYVNIYPFFYKFLLDQIRPYNNLYVLEHPDKDIRERLFFKNIELFAPIREHLNAILITQYINKIRKARAGGISNFYQCLAHEAGIPIKVIEGLLPHTRSFIIEATARYKRAVQQASKIKPWDLFARGFGHGRVAPTRALKRVILTMASLEGVDPDCIPFQVFVSRDPFESLGGFCKPFYQGLPILIFSPYYGTLRSCMGLAHEMGHGFHYWLNMKKGIKNELPPFLEEFAALSFEMRFLDRWFSDRGHGFMSLFLERIYLFVVRQLLWFMFEVENLKKAWEGGGNSTHPDKTWEELAADIFEMEGPSWRLPLWMSASNLFMLPFRSISYVLSALLYLYCHEKNTDPFSVIFVNQENGICREFLDSFSYDPDFGRELLELCLGLFQADV